MDTTVSTNDGASTIRIQLNGNLEHFEVGDLAELVAALNLTGRFAVERNGELVPRSLFADTRLEDGDRIEIVRAIGGG
ncbi:MAG: sulfur carrier protein ThiS [Thioalkalivibrionaceae bacterium]